MSRCVLLPHPPRFPHNTLDALCAWLHAGRPMIARTNATLVALNSGVYAQLDGIPIHPPVHLEAGERVELWWFIEAGVIEYQHAGTRRGFDEVPRRQLLTLLSMRGLQVAMTRSTVAEARRSTLK